APARAAARRCAGRSATCASAPAHAARGCAPAGATTPAARPRTAAAAADHSRRSRSSRAACGPAWPPSPPDRPDAPIPGALDLLNNEAPAGRARERELDFMTGELRQPRTHIDARCRGDPTAPHLTRLTVQQLVRDLVSMHTQTRLRSPSRPPRAPS